MGTKMAVAFANIFTNAIETEIIRLCPNKPLVWKRYIDDIFSLWNIDKKDTGSFIELANNHHPTIRFTAEISDTEITFLDTYVHKGYRFKRESILDVQTHFKPTESFQYTEYSSCHPPGVRKGFLKGEALRLLRTNSSEETFEENIKQFKRKLRARGYPDNLSEKILSEVKFSERSSALQNKQKTHKRILPFVTEYRPSVPNLKNILMEKWHLIKNQPVLREIFKDPPILSYRKGRTLKDTLVRAKLWRSTTTTMDQWESCLACLFYEPSSRYLVNFKTVNILVMTSIQPWVSGLIYGLRHVFAELLFDAPFSLRTD